jgi:threonylcarbamoyladenosine tRNA methylthiotransferase MtaB
MNVSVYTYLCCLYYYFIIIFPLKIYQNNNIRAFSIYIKSFSTSNLNCLYTFINESSFIFPFFGIQNGKRVETFFQLVQAIEEKSSIQRFRISSIEPNLLTSEMIAFLGASSKFVPHFHIPLQSGSNAVLRLMKRRYQRELYVDRVSSIKSVMPTACIGVDVIVGHPGETPELFLETYEFLNSLDISYLHVFPYSERPNTYAVDMKPKVDGMQKAERSKMLHILSDKKRRAFYESQAGLKGQVLFEESATPGTMEGFSENYVRVVVPFDPLQINTVQYVRYKNLNETGEMLGVVLE